MNYIKITKNDIANGKGVRVSLWLSSCDHHCNGCQNPQTWDTNVGQSFDLKALEELYSELRKPHISGITFTGGDPLHPNNRATVAWLANSIKYDFPDKDIWVWTGYSWEDIIQWNISDYILKPIDVLIDGKFEIGKKDISLPYCGSSNQRVISVQESLRKSKVVLYDK